MKSSPSPGRRLRPIDPPGDRPACSSRAARASSAPSVRPLFPRLRPRTAVPPTPPVPLPPARASSSPGSPSSSSSPSRRATRPRASGTSACAGLVTRSSPARPPTASGSASRSRSSSTACRTRFAPFRRATTPARRSAPARSRCASGRRGSTSTRRSSSAARRRLVRSGSRRACRSSIGSRTRPTGSRGGARSAIAPLASLDTGAGFPSQIPAVPRGGERLRGSRWRFAGRGLAVVRGAGLVMSSEPARGAAGSKATTVVKDYKEDRRP